MSKMDSFSWSVKNFYSFFSNRAIRNSSLTHSWTACWSNAVKYPPILKRRTYLFAWPMNWLSMSDNFSNTTYLSLHKVYFVIVFLKWWLFDHFSKICSKVDSCLTTDFGQTKFFISSAKNSFLPAFSQNSSISWSNDFCFTFVVSLNQTIDFFTNIFSSLISSK